ncbi:MAG: phosphotransferase [Chromatiales bacterium]|nr:phosphotransferase [Chromatiales bacterium]
MSAHPYAALTPEVILDAVETFDLRCTGALHALNSYENRVYQVEHRGRARAGGRQVLPPRALDRRRRSSRSTPSRSSSPSAEIPVVAPLARADGATLHAPRRLPLRAVSAAAAGARRSSSDRDVREWLGRFLGRIHAVGRSAAASRTGPALDVETFGASSRRVPAGQHDCLPPRPARRLRAALSGEALATMRAQRFERARDLPALRLHGDCHAGNVLWTDGGRRTSSTSTTAAPARRCRTCGCCCPATRDEHGRRSSADVLTGYEEFARVRPPRAAPDRGAAHACACMHYAAWLARRWDDPAFPTAFPWFNTPALLGGAHPRHLREQRAALDEPALAWRPD